MIDAQWQFFISGGAHAYYGLLAVLGLAIAIALGFLTGKWAWLAAIFAFGVFVDLWAHGFQH